MNTDGRKEVYFDEYCSICKYCDLPEEESPCWACLDEPTNLYSHRPVNWKEKKE